MAKHSSCKMEFKKDEFGREILLKDDKFQVMMEWEKPYMEACIDCLKPSGDVLEIGFGCGYSATHIQKYNPKSHTIIEYHPVVAEKARAFAKQHPNVIVIQDTWQNALKNLGVFDEIFFDDYPLESEKEVKELEKDRDQSNVLVQQGNQLIADVDKKLPFLKELRYSNQDLQEFLDLLLKQPGTSGSHLVHFFSDLEERGQISSEQKNLMFDTLKKKGMEMEVSSSTPKKTFDFRGPNERVFLFLEEALNRHMRIGSRFSCFFSSSQSKFEDEKFFKQIILNPNLDYHEEMIDIEVPSNCDYYDDRQALVMTLTKRA